MLIRDEKATKDARARHAAGEKQIRALFFPTLKWQDDGVSSLLAGLFGAAAQHRVVTPGVPDESRMKQSFLHTALRRLVAQPMRSRENTPPVRSAEQRARKRRRAIVKASRRRNR